MTKPFHDKAGASGLSSLDTLLPLGGQSGRSFGSPHIYYCGGPGLSTESESGGTSMGIFAGCFLG